MQPQQGGPSLELRSGRDGGPGRKAIAYYNYHSMPIPSSGIDSLIQFVTSQLSLSLLQMFFCCDVRVTPSETIDLVEKIPNCEILHLTLNGQLETEISNRIVRMAAIQDPCQLVLISDEGGYSNFMQELSAWQLAVFHPPKADLSLKSHANLAFELPMTLTDSSISLVRMADSNSSQNQKEPPIDLRHVNKSLEAVLSKVHDLNGQMNVMKEVKKVFELLKEESKPPSNKELEEAEEEQLEGEEEEKVAEEKPPKFIGNGWDGFQPDPELIGKTETWDDLDKEMEAERAATLRPGGGEANGSPFAQKKNPFETSAAGGPFDASQQRGGGGGHIMGGGMMPPRGEGLGGPPGNRYTQDIFDRGTPTSSPFHHGHHQEHRFPFQQEKPFGKPVTEFLTKGSPMSFQQERGPPQERNPFGGGGPPRIQRRDGGYQPQSWRNPFAGGGPGGPEGGGPFQPRERLGSDSVVTKGEGFVKPAPQCPQWEDRAHRAANDCPLWHPHKQCIFFPGCRVLAANCGYAHPFCTDGECQCDANMKDPQLNHFFGEE